MRIHFDVVVDMDLGLLPLREGIGRSGQGFEGGLVQRFEERAARTAEFLEVAAVIGIELFAQRLLQRPIEKNVRLRNGAMTQRSTP